MNTFKDLPPGSQPWGRAQKDGLAMLTELEAIARRICQDFGLDFSNPTAGLGTGPMPSVNNPVQLKLPSLKDLDIRDAQDGDVLTFDGATGTWVARRHNAVQLPKEFPQGDPDSYYTEPEEPVEEPEVPVEGEWFSPVLGTNLYTDPDINNSYGDWNITDDPTDGFSIQAATNISMAPGGGIDGGSGFSVVCGPANMPDTDYYGTPIAETERINWLCLSDIPLDTGFYNVAAKLRSDPGYSLTVYKYMEILDASGNVLNRRYNNYDVVTASGWTTLRLDSYNQLAQDYPMAASRRAWLQLGMHDPQGGEEFVFDHVLVSADTQDYFSGNTPADGAATYKWLGVPDASASQKSSARELQMPTDFPLNQDVTIKGRNFPPGADISLRDDWWMSGASTTADGSGTFTVTLNVTAGTSAEEGDGPMPGDTGYIAIMVNGGAESLYPDVTYI